MNRIALAIRQWYGSMRIKHKVFLLLAVMMGFCAAITFGALQYAYSIYDGQIYEKSSQVLNLSATGIENELRKIEQLSFNVATDEEIQNMLRTMNGDPPGYEALVLRSKIESRLVQYAGYVQNIYSIQLTDMAGNEYTAGMRAPFTPEQRRLIEREAAKEPGSARWIYPGAADASLISARIVRSYAANLELDAIGMVIVRVRLDQIVEDVSAGTALKDGELIVASGADIVYPLEGGVGLPELAKGAGRGGYELTELDGRPYFLSHFYSANTGWTYYSLIPFGHIFERIAWMKNVLLIFFVVSLLTVLALAVQFSKGITKPIEALIARMKQAQKGDFSLGDLDDASVVAKLPMDEVGQLHRTFRTMIGRIDELITENYAKQLTIKETEFKALQAQINPHFLYNTLESVNWLAKLNGQPQISSMVEALGFLLRNSMSLKDSLITVGQEIDIVRHYVQIQQYRFAERLDFRLDVPERLHRYCIPKLTLQPLLENAIHHALEPSVDPCRIAIRAVEEAESFLLVVEDDGPGMSPERLELVRAGDASTNGKGIGLSNIGERIALSFGEAYGIQVDSEPGAGTRVAIRLPYETGCSRV